MKINNSNINALNTQQNKAEKPEKQQAEERPQLKEHCSSKAGNALRGMVLGLTLAAGIAGAKAMPVQAAVRNENEPVSVTQETETAAPQTELEAAVDDMMEQQQSVTVTFRTGKQGHCTNSLSLSNLVRSNIDSAKITSDGQLVLYDSDDSVINRFNLNTGADTLGKINLQTGSRFEESDSKIFKKGDYVKLSEDATKFIVYNRFDEEIGTVNTKIAQDNSNHSGNQVDDKTFAKAMCIMGGAAVTLLGGGYVAENVIDKVLSKRED